MIYHRQNQEMIEDIQSQEQAIQFLYGHPMGRCILPVLIYPFVSKLLTLTDYTPWSKAKINHFVEKFQIDLSKFEKEVYPHFASFFTRKYRKEYIPVMDDSQLIYAPCQGKLQVLNLTDDSLFFIKGQFYNLLELIQAQDWVDYFRGGLAFVYRLSLQDYHRYHFAGRGQIIMQRYIKGKLHSVRPIVHGFHPVYKENQREYCIIETNTFNILQMEVGALTVGKIHNHPLLYGDCQWEKGYFSLGGSSIIVLYPKNSIRVDQDIIQNSQKGIECQVQLGERIGMINV